MALSRDHPLTDRQATLGCTGSQVGKEPSSHVRLLIDDGRRTHFDDSGAAALQDNPYTLAPEINSH